jgi:hypothetical protein
MSKSAQRGCETMDNVYTSRRTSSRLLCSSSVGTGCVLIGRGILERQKHNRLSSHRKNRLINANKPS